MHQGILAEILARERIAELARQVNQTRHGDLTRPRRPEPPLRSRVGRALVGIGLRLDAGAARAAEASASDPPRIWKTVIGR